MRSASYERFAGSCALVGAVGGVGYSVAFVTYLKTGSVPAAKVSVTLLLGGGVLATAVFVGLYDRIREGDPSFALWGLVLGVAAGVGTAAHGGYDLANFAHPPAGLNPDLPNAVDPRGLMTFGLTGLSVLISSWLIARGSGAGLPRRLGSLGMLSGALLLVVYLGRLFVLNPKNPGLLTVAVLSGYVVNPAWLVWLGLELRRGGPPVRPVEP
jgi:hypothetical protein